MKTHKNENGFILLIAIVWIMGLSLITVGILGMARTGVRNEQQWVKMEECYMYAQAALSISRTEVIDEFNTYFTSHNNDPSAFDTWFDAQIDGKSRVFPTGASQSNPAALSSFDSVGEPFPVAWEDGKYYTEIIKQQKTGRIINLLLRTTCTMGNHMRTFEEHVVIGMGSAVFKYAYFINNNGWFYGSDHSKIIINGDVRANANISLEGTTTFNGKLYASQNPNITTPSGEVVLGQITDEDGNLDHSGYAMNTALDYANLWLNADGHIKARNLLENPETLTDHQIESSLLFNPQLEEEERILEGATPLAMPYLGALELYESDATKAASNGWAALRYQDADGNWQINTTGVFDGDLVINGDFQIMGPFVVKGDLILKTGTNGYGALNTTDIGSKQTLTDSEVANILNIPENTVNKQSHNQAVALKLDLFNGKGGFFVDRNINIIGDLKSTASTNTEEDPFISLAARGNIIIGDTKDINQEWISPGEDFENGQMISYETDDSMYQNSDNSTAFDGNYAGIDAIAGDDNAISIGTDNIHLKYNEVYVSGEPTGKTFAVKQEKWLKTKYYSDDGEVIYTQEYWKNIGEEYYQAGVEDEVIERPIARKYEKIWPEVTQIVTWPENLEGHNTYTEDNNHLVVVSDNVQLLETLQAKVNFARDNALQMLKIEVDGEIYSITDVSNSTDRFIDENGTKKTGFDVRISTQIPSADIPKGVSGTVDRRYFETSLSADDYAKLNPLSPSRIDAVLYTNHLIAGDMGLNASINGALVARDEAIQFKAGTLDNPTNITFNWDKRLVSNTQSETTSGSLLNTAISGLIPITFDINNRGEGKITGVVFQREIKSSTLRN